MTDIKVAVFDVDGVLLDSLEAHLQVCRDEAQKFNLDIQVPDAREFRGLVTQGAIISPMVEFFHTIGFPRPLAELATEHYRRDFTRQYPVRPFDGVSDMLSTVAATGARLAIATANTRAIISAALGDTLRWFDPRFIFAEDDPKPVSKAQALSHCAHLCGVEPSAVLYIGDQPRDFAAAQTAHTQFLGVTYGWGITTEETRFAVVHSPHEIARYIQAHTPK